MKLARRLLTTTTLLLLGGAQTRWLFASASPSVNVALKASFHSAPYLIELLESAADEDPSVYYPILDRIADGYFDTASTDEQLYNTFLKLLREDDLFHSAEALSSFQFGLSIRNSAPRIEAQYQYYRTSVEPILEQSGAKDCGTWLQFSGKQFCSPSVESEDASIPGLSTELLPFDRSFGADPSALSSILYTDITSPSFRKFHHTLSKGARDGKTVYRVRHKPSTAAGGKALGISGYGVALDLKRTDYIVIDDRQAEGVEANANEDTKSKSVDLERVDDVVEDLQPLSGSQLADLDLKAASYITSSENPLDTLVKLTQDFPKHSSWLVGHNASEAFLKEHRANRVGVLPAGFSVLWVNGLQIDARKVDPFSLLDHLRRERKLLEKFGKMGLTAPEAIQVLSHSALLDAQRDRETQRYDWRDAIEGGNVIIWLNDIEKDKRYQDWPTNLMAFLQRGYPGQLPSVRKDLHNAIVPVDFSDPQQVYNVVEPIQDIIRRKVPCRWGLVPVTESKEAAEQARVVYYLVETYGLSAVMQYLEGIVKKRKSTGVDVKLLQATIGGRKARKDKEVLSPEEIVGTASYENQVGGARSYLSRLGADGPSPPMFVNGVPVKLDDDWLPSLSQRVTIDLQTIQKGIYEEIVTEETWLPEIWLADSSPRRNPLIIPPNEKKIRLFSLPEVYQGHEELVRNVLPQVSATEAVDDNPWTQLLVTGDFESDSGLELAAAAIDFRQEHSNVNVVFVHNGKSKNGKAARLASLIPAGTTLTAEQLANLATNIRGLAAADEPQSDSHSLWPDVKPILNGFNFESGERGLVINGRKLGPIPTDMIFDKEDFKSLYKFELKRRIQPAADVIEDLQLSGRIKGCFDAAQLCSLLAAASVSDLPEGIYETMPQIRIGLFNDWNASHTSITIGDNTTATIQLIATIDPATEVAQRWVPIIKALSELDSVYTRIFLNPKDKLQELPVKRFYRSVLESKPIFDEDGSLQDPSALFAGMPRKTLMTMAMDVPPSWLVASKESIYDLDNIKLSSVADDHDVNAVYELESILIEGHSRDVTSGQAPRGAQLVLSTAKDPHFADTIIMANLGYFQFKANPGYYTIGLQTGRSAEIFNIDSIGAMGYSPQPGDETTDVTMMSFQGLTLFPRLSRKPGKKEEDVLGSAQPPSASDFLVQGAKAVDGLLSKAGIKDADTGKYLSAAWQRGTNVLAKLSQKSADVMGKTEEAPKTKARHADINIFSVASGHLYERMLNIMMVSVMRHTNHTVKFWFIEQFLSPSFKSFVPTLAAEYGFDFEMVSYKWPHWLRAQKEKQREIWGYKILFLDVLFPLDLDKVIFVDSDQIVRTDMYELVTHDLHGAPYGFTPMCDSRVEMEGFRFWKQGYWKNFLRGRPYHISALYVVDLKRFRQLAAGDRLRQQYHQLSADPNSLANLDQDLPNNMQFGIPIHSLPQDWLWCETWCSDESLATARTIDLCNNPLTKEPKLDRARRQVPEWTLYDDEIAALARRTHEANVLAGEGAGRVQEEEQIAKDQPAMAQKQTTDSNGGSTSIKDEL